MLPRSGQGSVGLDARRRKSEKKGKPIAVERKEEFCKTLEALQKKREATAKSLGAVETAGGDQQGHGRGGAGGHIRARDGRPGRRRSSTVSPRGVEVSRGKWKREFCFFQLTSRAGSVV